MRCVDLNVSRIHSKPAWLHMGTPVVVLAVGPFPLRMSVCLFQKNCVYLFICICDFGVCLVFGNICWSFWYEVACKWESVGCADLLLGSLTWDWWSVSIKFLLWFTGSAAIVKKDQIKMCKAFRLVSSHSIFLCNVCSKLVFTTQVFSCAIRSAWKSHLLFLRNKS